MTSTSHRPLLFCLILLSGSPLGADTMDFGDLPDTPYLTRLVANGARHAVTQSLFLGTQPPDAEADGAASALANGDDLAGLDDEDGIDPSTLRPVPGMALAFPVKATNTTGGPAKIFGFADWNADGDFADAGETSSMVVPTGSAGVTFRLPWSVPGAATTTQPVAVRLRLSSDTALGPVGAANNGEVEDFFITVHPQGNVLDFGDLPDAAAGSVAGTFGSGSPPDHKTRAADGGPSHVIRPGLFFTNDTGSGDADVDGEIDGQPTSNADGDNLGGNDDELGLFHSLTSQVFIPAGMASELDLVLMTSLAVTNTTGTASRVAGFIDANSDGDFADPGEQAPVILVPGDGSVATVTPTFSFRIGGFAPATTFTRVFATRFRITTDAAVGPDGAATDGEVHDSLISHTFTLDPYDTEDLDFGDLPAPYPTRRVSNGARHVPTQALYLGTQPPDGEPDGLPSPGSNGDDTHATDDENAIRPPALFPVPGSAISFPIKATNVTGGMARIFGFVDWNADGDFLDADESSTVNVPNGSAAVVFNLPWNVPATASTTLPVAVRLRLSTSAALNPVGAAPDGEVEDFFIAVRDENGWLDYGDLPDIATGTAAGDFNGGTVPDYRTRAADNGPSHVLRTGLHFANASGSGDAPLDAESDGQPTPAADGDDTNGDDDEIGLSVTMMSNSSFIDGVHYRDVALEVILPVTNTTGTTAKVYAFIDWNDDGDFDEFEDNMANVGYVPSVVGDGSQTTVRARSVVIFDGVYGLPTAYTRTVAARFRISTDTALTSDGAAGDGEVHDQLITLHFDAEPDNTARMDYGDLPSPLYKTTYLDDGARHFTGQALFLGTQPPDSEMDGLASTPANGDDLDATDDEDGVPAASLSPVAGMPMTFPVRATNVGIGPATIFGFADWNADGDFADADETSSIAVPNGSASVVFNLPWNVPATASTTQPVAVRLRLSSQTSLGDTGPAIDGEAEDFFITVNVATYDFGDLPDSLAGIAPGVLSNLSTVSQADYRTRLADDGPRHVIRPDLVLFNDSDPTGVHIDADADGVPTSDATGDNFTGDDDEQVMYATVISQTAGNFTATTFELEMQFVASIAVKNETGAPATLYGFSDVNNDGDFVDFGEGATVVVPSAPGYSAHLLTFTLKTVAPKSVMGFTKTLPVRFRLSSSSTLGPNGPAPDGEVEDYMLSFSATWDPWWPNEIGRIPADLFDKGHASRLDGSKHFTQGNAFDDEKWTIGQTQFSGPNPLLTTNFLESLGTAIVPYSHRVRFGNGAVASHLGFLIARDLAGFRAFMSNSQLTGENDTPGNDSDNDGDSNFMEYAFGTHPGLPGQRPSFKPVHGGDGAGGSELIMPYLRRTGGTLAGTTYQTPELIYHPQGTNDLSAWDMPMEVPLTPPSGQPAAPSGYEWGAVRLAVPAHLPQRGFMRLLIDTP